LPQIVTVDPHSATAQAGELGAKYRMGASFARRFRHESSVIEKTGRS
jgi:hypothetical protein